MCGIAGVVAFDPGRPVPEGLAQAMADRLEHRGPDGSGVHEGPGYALSQRRLAIVDLAGGAQPMGTTDGRLWVTFNGEIYNHLELRAELEAKGAVFRTHSDTEVLLHGFRAWGTGLAARLRGMFALAIVDETTHELYVARDRLGKKPFHWTVQDGVFAFASEIKGLHALQFPRAAARCWSRSLSTGAAARSAHRVRGRAQTAAGALGPRSRRQGAAWLATGTRVRRRRRTGARRDPAACAPSGAHAATDF